MQKDVKYPSLSSYMLKPYRLLTQGFDHIRTAYKKLFKHMCNFGARESVGRGEDFQFLS